MEILLVRHAQPEWNRGRTAQVDPGLTELGVRQAALTAARLRDDTFDEVLVSTATRAIETAEPMLPDVGDAAVERRMWMHEIHMPAAWEGTPSEEVGRALREARDRPREAWWEGMPGGETFNDFHSRVTIGLIAELAEHGVERDQETGLWHVPDAPPRILMVAHAGTNSVILGHLLGLSPEPWEWERFASDHASLTVLRAVPIAGSWIFSLQSFSDVGHLPPELVTA
jgi:broad specificity phosphatase PhoE